jgi:hypothetical protein
MFGDPFVANGEVAILPRADASPLDVLEIAIVEYVGSVFIRLVDGRMFATIGGKCLTCTDTQYAVPAKDAHREALQKKK